MLSRAMGDLAIDMSKRELRDSSPIEPAEKSREKRGSGQPY